MSDIEKLRADLEAWRQFPVNACPASRHAQLIGDQMIDGDSYDVITQGDPAHAGVSILLTVLSLYMARTANKGLRERVKAHEDLPAVPDEPPPGLLMSMAMRYDHALGCPGYYDHELFAVSGLTHKQRLESTMRTMRQLWEEAVGKGFYRPEVEDDYASLAASIAAAPQHGGSDD